MSTHVRSSMYNLLIDEELRISDQTLIFLQNQSSYLSHLKLTKFLIKILRLSSSNMISEN